MKQRLCSPQDCNRCFACRGKCPVDAITIEDDNKGFWMPVIDENKCTDCGKCTRTCPVINRVKRYDCTKNVYASWSQDPDVVLNSNSGGVFEGLANIMLNNCGVVYGAAFNENNEVIHTCVTKAEDVDKVIRKKYVQSNMKGVYSSIDRALRENKSVLFYGVPCLCAGVRNFVGYNENLLVVDMLCAGRPSPKVFKSYLDYVSKGRKPVRINFTDKTLGWKNYSMRIDFEDGSFYSKSMHEDPFLLGMHRNYMVKSSCYDCRYADTKRVGDITLANFYGLKGKNIEEKGVTLVTANTKLGKTYLKLMEDYKFVRKEFDEAVVSNFTFSRPAKRPEDNDKFWEDFNNMPPEEFWQSSKYFSPDRKRDLVKSIIHKFGM